MKIFKKEISLLVGSSNLLYHVTYLPNIDKIRSKGLIPGKGQTFGKSYQGYSKGKLFLTEWDGLSFWVDKYSDHAEHNYGGEDIVVDGVFPIVLRVNVDKADIDEIGSKDARSNSYYITESVPAKAIDVWNGSKWVKIKQLDVDDLKDQIIQETDTEEIEEDDGEEYTIYYPNLDMFLPKKR